MAKYRILQSNSFYTISSANNIALCRTIRHHSQLTISPLQASFSSLDINKFCPYLVKVPNCKLSYQSNAYLPSLKNVNFNVLTTKNINVIKEILKIKSTINKMFLIKKPTKIYSSFIKPKIRINNTKILTNKMPVRDIYP